MPVGTVPLQLTGVGWGALAIYSHIDSLKSKMDRVKPTEGPGKTPQ